MTPPPGDQTGRPDGAPLRPDADYYCADLPTRPLPGSGPILVTGPSGYVGGRVVHQLVRRGYRVRVLVRGGARFYRTRVPEAEVVEGDALDPGSLRAALEGVAVAYYLIHAMVARRDGSVSDALAAARNFRTAAEAAGVERIIYLGSLGHCGGAPGAAAADGNAVADELRAGPIPVTSLHASIIIGSGSASFETIKHLVGALPLILIPTWGRNPKQPVAIRDVAKYLVGVLENPETSGRSYDIGGADVLTYAEMMRTCAEILGKRRCFVRVPLSGTRFLGYMMSLLTPVPAPITLCLARSLKAETTCRTDAVRDAVPFAPLSFRDAVVRALEREEQDGIATRWSDAYPPASARSLMLHELRRPPQFGARFSLRTDRPASALFAALTRIGGREGWFTGNWMWRLRGAFDRLIFGVGSARGRRSGRDLQIHDVIDFWRVEDLQPDRRLLLRGEMRMPGRAWLEFTIRPDGDANILSLRAHYATGSVWGRIYWRVFQPFHWYIFARVLRQIEARSF